MDRIVPMDAHRILPGTSLTSHPAPQTSPSASRYLSDVYITRNAFGVIYAGDNARVHCGDKNYGPQERLRCVEDAEFNSYGQVHTACHPATRKDLLRCIEAWAQEPDGKSIFWLNGMAGTGKSTIAYTIAKWLCQQRESDLVHLGASFFFKRGEGDRASAALFFPTIVRQLMQKVSGLSSVVDDVLQTDPYIYRKSLGEQFDRLLSKPLHVLRTHSWPRRYVVVVDALDECQNESDIKTVLQLWSSLPPTTKASLRLFLTSRPELPIRLGFKRMTAGTHQDAILHEVPRPIIEHDIHAFLQDAFTKIRQEYNLEPISDVLLADNWPGVQALQVLTDMAVPLFIVATTICRFVQASEWDPQQRLETILQSRKVGSQSQMGQLYQSVLQQMIVSRTDEGGQVKLWSEFRTVIGSIIILAEPLSRRALAALLDVSSAVVALRLKPLHSVLQLSTDGDADTPIRPIHLSFNEYLTSPGVQHQPYGVDEPAAHDILWRCCLRLLSGRDGLQENVCGLGFPGQMRHDFSLTQINKHLPPAVSYACRYWVYHVQSSRSQLCDEDEIHVFLQRHFLHWLEALSFFDQLADAIEFIRLLQLNIAAENSRCVSTFLEDARRFILANRFVGELAPLQLYSSAVAFAPQNSTIRSVCGHIPVWIEQAPITPLTWSLELQKLEGHTSWVYAVAFSPDGSMLASASRDDTVRLWKVSTGQEVQKLEGHTSWVKAVAFSPDGSILASASADRTIRLWKANTGQEVQKLEGHNHEVYAIAFSPDGLLLASASWDQTVRLWYPNTGQEVQKLEGHTSWVYAVVFSPDGSMLASASGDWTVRLWKVSTGQEVQKLEGHTSWVHAVAFSPNGLLLASASRDDTVRLWRLSTGREVQKLEGHTYYVKAVAFSPDGSMLASAAGDRTVRLWKTNTGQEVQKLEGHTYEVYAVAFSPDGSMLASASGDRTVRLWKVSTVQEVQKLEGHAHEVHTIAFSPDGSVLASASGDHTVRLWKASTGQEVQKLEGHTSWVKAVAFSPNGLLLASASGDRTVRLWNARTGQEVQKLEGHTSWVKAVVFSSDGSMLASASGDRTVRLWKASMGQEVQKFEGHNHEVNAVAFSPDGSILASASWDRTVRLWKVSTGQEVQKLEGHTREVNAVAFSPDGSILASASGDQTVRLWFPNTGQEVQKFEDVKYIVSLSFTPDNSILITNRGHIRINVASASVLRSDPVVDHGLMLNHDWIEYYGDKLLWLPQECRSDVFAWSGNTFAIGCNNGFVIFLRIKYP